MTMITTTATTVQSSSSHQKDVVVLNNDTRTNGINHIEQNIEGIWIGIDFGTSNCACAVWDSTRGRPKWMRLSSRVATPEASGKLGRIVPSVVFLMPQSEINRRKENDHDYYDLDGTSRKALVGNAALEELQQRETSDNNNDEQEQAQEKEEEGVLLIRSVKRLLGISRKKDLDPDWIQSLPFELVEQDEELWIETACGITIRPVDIVTILLQSIRSAAQTYLQRYIPKKNMKVPDGGGGDGSFKILNCVVGVPAYFSQRQCHFLEQACHRAGFSGHVSTVVESTAAAMAYGLFVGSSNMDNDVVNNNATNPLSKKKRILVLDMGGGTTDITVAEMTPPNDNEDDEAQPTFTVVVTEGDHRLGGDDMDQALLQWVMDQLVHSTSTSPGEKEKQQHHVLTRSERNLLLRECRRVKEYLCGDGQDAKQRHPDSCTIYYHQNNNKKLKMEISYQDLERCMAPLLQRIDQLVKSALLQYQSKSAIANDDIIPADITLSLPQPLSSLVDEVVLVGGGTRVPAVRELLRDMFAPLPLCLSVNAMSAVAEGAAIQAAIQSHLVPTYELQSAMMLDTLPHAIGIAVGISSCQRRDDVEHDDGKKVEDNLLVEGDQVTFVELLQKDAPLPASGHATFTLARVDQRGITVTAVENVGPKFPLQKIQEFTFLLHRLRPDQLQKMDRRTIEIAMRMEMDGKLVVSYFDPNDPEHIQKKKRKQQQQQQQEHASQNKDSEKLTKPDGLESDVVTMDQIILLVACAVLFVLYVMAKLMFHIPEEST